MLSPFRTPLGVRRGSVVALVLLTATIAFALAGEGFLEGFLVGLVLSAGYLLVDAGARRGGALPSSPGADEPNWRFVVAVVVAAVLYSAGLLLSSILLSAGEEGSRRSTSSRSGPPEPSRAPKLPVPSSWASRGHSSGYEPGPMMPRWES
jgi:hypothetical protein